MTISNSVQVRARELGLFSISMHASAVVLELFSNSVQVPAVGLGLFSKSEKMREVEGKDH